MRVYVCGVEWMYNESNASNQKVMQEVKVAVECFRSVRMDGYL